MLLTPEGRDGNGFERQLTPGDVLAGGDIFSLVTDTGGVVWPAAAIASGLIVLSGAAGGVTDTTDTAANIITALSGNGQFPNVIPGTTFRLTVIQKAAQAVTFAAGVGVISGTGGSAVKNITASTWREYLITILNVIKPVTIVCTNLNASKILTFVLPAGIAAIPFLGSNGNLGSLADLVGASVTGTNMAAAPVRVTGVTQGQGGVIGVTIDTNTIGANAAPGVAITFGPTVQFDGIRSGTL